MDLDSKRQCTHHWIENKPNFEGPGIAVRLYSSRNGIEIAFDAYSTCDMESGPIIYIEQWEEKLMLHVWADIDSEDPTHSICLEGAREDTKHLYGIEDCA
jgi:hypothetical protein